MGMDKTLSQDPVTSVHTPDTAAMAAKAAAKAARKAAKLVELMELARSKAAAVKVDRRTTSFS